MGEGHGRNGGDDHNVGNASKGHVLATPLGFRRTMSFAAAGLMAGLASRCVTAPADRLRVLMATGQLKMGSEADRPFVRQVQELVAREGVRGLWRGNLANCLKVAPTKAIKFACYENCLVTFCANPRRPTLTESIVISCAVTSVSTILAHPLDTIRTRLAAGVPGGIVSIFRSVVAENGMMGIMKGVTPALVSNVPFIGVNLGIFTSLKTQYNDYIGKEPLTKLPTSVMFGVSIMSTIAAELVAYPLFVLKTNMQAGQGDTWRTTAQTIMQQRGSLGLYHGVSVTALKSMPAAFITYFVYENAKAALIEA
mmetsp:Transcript_35791/g.82130  ORF Transcript_35791/g.82130 Transcript_35791/m.82130 type:complete len:310 (-) Transcript_35791:292-1221(-)